MAKAVGFQLDFSAFETALGSAFSSVSIDGEKISGRADTDSPRPFTVLIRHASNTDRFLVDGDEGGRGME